MKISQDFTIGRPRARVWAFFSDVPAVASCLPGAEITADKGDGTYAGKVTAKLGPFGASFEGEAIVRPDAASWRGHVEGRGTDRKGGSRSRMVMDYRLEEVAAGTRVTVDADITLSGPIAQFGRTGIIREASNILVRDFVANLETRLAAEAEVDALAAEPAATVRAPAPPREIHGFRLIWASLVGWLRGLIGRPTA